MLISFLKSAIFFIRLFFFKQKADVIFYYPQHFNRGNNGINLYFIGMIDSCKNHEISYLVFEEPDYSSNKPRNKSSVPFDFLFLIIRLLRKLFKSEENTIKRDQKIGSILSRRLLRNLEFTKVILLSQSMVSFFRGLNKECNIFDVQHGILHNNKANYLMNNKVEPNLISNDVSVLLSGPSYQDILIRNEREEYFRKHTYVLGSGISSDCIFHTSFNNNCLVTLQFTSDHINEENNVLLETLEDFISNNSSLNFYLKHHPRFNNEVDLTYILSLENVKVTHRQINDCFMLCSLHITSYSTSTFEAALYGIPTILINPLKKYNYFVNDFKYPISYQIEDFKKDELYQRCSKIVLDWAKGYYHPYNEKVFLDIIR